jgi:hypothetical protein
MCSPAHRLQTALTVLNARIYHMSRCHNQEDHSVNLYLRYDLSSDLSSALIMKPHQATDSVAWVRKLTIPTERPRLVGEVICSFGNLLNRGLQPPEGTRRHPTEPLEPRTSSDPRTHEDSSPNWGQRDGYLRPYSRFSRPKPLLFYQVAPQLYPRGWNGPRSRPTTFFSDSAGNRARDSGSVARNSDH